MANEYRIVYCIEPLEGNSNNSLAETLSFLDLDEKGVLLYIKTKHGEILQIKDEKVNVLEKINDAFIQVGLTGDTTVKLSMMFVTRPEGATDGWNITIPNLNISELMAGINPADFNLYVNNDKHGNTLVNFVDPQSVWFDDESGEAKVNLKTRLEIATGLYKSKLLQCFKHFRRIMEHEIYSMCSVLKVPSALATYMYDVAESVLEILEVSESINLLNGLELEEIIRDLDPIEKGPGFVTIDLSSRDVKKFYDVGFTHNGMGEIENKFIPPVVFPITLYVANSNAVNDVDVATAVVNRDGYVLNFSKHGYNPDGSFSNLNLISVSKNNKIMVRGETKVHIRFSSVYRINPTITEVVFDSNGNGKGFPLQKFRNAEFVGGMSYHAHTMLVGSKSGSPYILNTGFIQETTGGPGSYYMLRGPVYHTQEQDSSNIVPALRKLGEVGRTVNIRPMLSRPIDETVKARVGDGIGVNIDLGFNTIEYAGGAHYGATLTVLGITKLTKGFDLSLSKLEDDNVRDIATAYYKNPSIDTYENVNAFSYSFFKTPKDMIGVPHVKYKSKTPHDFARDGREIPNVYDYSYKMMYVAEDLPDLYIGYEKNWYNAEDMAPIKAKDLLLSNKVALAKKNWYSNFPMHDDYVKKYGIYYDLSSVSFKPKQYIPVYGQNQNYLKDSHAITGNPNQDRGDMSWYTIAWRLAKAVNAYQGGGSNLYYKLHDVLNFDYERILRKNISASLDKYRITSDLGWVISEDHMKDGGYAFGFFGNVPPWGYGKCQSNHILSIRNYPSFFIDPELAHLNYTSDWSKPYREYNYFGFRTKYNANINFDSRNFYSNLVYKFLTDDGVNIPLMPNYMTLNDARGIKPYNKGEYDVQRKGFLPKVDVDLEEPTYNMIYKHFTASTTKPSHPTLRFKKWNIATKDYKKTYLRLRHTPPSICFQTQFSTMTPNNYDGNEHIFSAYIYRPRLLNSEPDHNYQGLGLYEGRFINMSHGMKKNEVLEIRMYRGIHKTYNPPSSSLLIHMSELTFKDDTGLQGFAALVNCDTHTNHVLLGDYNLHSHKDYITLTDVMHNKVPSISLTTLKDTYDYAYDMFYNRYGAKDMKISHDPDEFRSQGFNGTVDISRIKMSPTTKWNSLGNTINEPNKMGEIWTHYMNLDRDLTFDFTTTGEYFNDSIISRLLPYVTPDQTQIATVYARIGTCGDTMYSEWVRLPVYKTKITTITAE